MAELGQSANVCISEIQLNYFSPDQSDTFLRGWRSCSVDVMALCVQMHRMSIFCTCMYV